MKLNYKRTILVGFAFFLICLFWQVYDNIIPKILTDKFGLSQFWSGVIMALDNILAVFLLPLFGTISDKHKGKRGKRTPFILIGTLVAVIAFVSLSFADNMQLTKISDVSAAVSIETTDAESMAERENALLNLYNSDVLINVPGSSEKQTLRQVFATSEEFLAEIADPVSFTEYVVPARQAYAWKMTCENPVTLIFFMIVLLVVLVSMATFRSPAVALMPDVTPKPLRSKANAIINLMGAVGGILVLVLGIVFGTGKAQNVLMNYTSFFIFNCAIMLVALLVFMLTVKEPQWAKEADEAYNDVGEESESTDEKRKLTKAEFRSLIFILMSVVFWYMGYNAVTSKYSVYAGNVLELDYNLTLIVAQAAAIISYIPVGFISQKVGRKKTIIAGVIMLGVAFGAASFMRAGSNIWVMNALFALAGIGWATINVNSYPMVVELAKSGDVGKYTGFYYTASMSAQIVTPMFSGIFLDSIGMTTLFPYAAIFVALALITMLFVKHGDSVVTGKKAPALSEAEG
ncbi:MAG: SLC45 family MFS transporter [Ruminococcaceae bacterium]|nr:SLC45 family MFS transporter [Oscillospiraceae bacterium]